jgi:hypothetical protein
MLLEYLKIRFHSVSMTEENIIYEDKRYKFYEDRIYSKTRFEYLIKRESRKGNGRGKNKNEYYSFSHITKGAEYNGVRTVAIEYPITMEKINSVYLA